MRRALALVAAAAALGVSPTPASACDPDRFPNCRTHCGWLAWRYAEIAEMAKLRVPPWPRTGVAGCP